jgi:ubiquinone biosynthesis protein COQ4
MINASVTTPNPTPFVTVFLDLLDRSSELLGTNVPPIIQIEKLRQLPIGTFGRSLADFLDQHNLQPFTTGPRRKQLHDAVHVITGYGTDPIGEAEVQAFLLGSKLRIGHLLIGVGLLRIIHKQNRSLNISWNDLWRAYQRGRNSQLNVGTWQPELLWEMPLTQVQEFYQV